MTMKSRIRRILICVGILFAFAFLLFSCGKSENGTYYRYLNGKIDRSDYIKLDGGKWSEDGSGKGTYTVKNGTISFYISELSETKSVYDGTLTDNGVLTIKSFGEEKYYCRDGKIPKDFTAGEQSDNDNRQNPEESKVTVTYQANGGAFADGNGETTKQTVEKGSTLTAPTAPTRKNYTFAGWAKQKSGSTLWQFASDKATEDLTLYAVWKQESAVIFSVDGAGMNDNKEIRMLVDHNTSAVSLAQKVVCSSDSVWKLYYDKLGQMEIPTKIAAKTSGELSDGDNIFYIVVSTQDGTQSNLYTLNVYRSFEVTLRYSLGDKVTEKKVYTGYECTAMKDPEVRGYTFNGWKDQNGNVIKTTFVPYEDMTLCAVLTAKEYRVTLSDEEGGMSQTTRTLTYDKSYTLPVPRKKEYTFLGWYLGDIQMTDGKGKSLSPWTFTEDKVLNAKYNISRYTVSVTYNDNFVEVIGAGVYEYGSTVKLKAEPFLVGTFLGWYNGNTKLTGEKEYTFKLEKEEDIRLQIQLDIPKDVSAVFQFSSDKTQITKLLYKDAQKIYIPSFVTSIGSSAFYGCAGLTSITIPNSVKSICSYAFYNCAGLTSVTIGNGVTSIGVNAFDGTAYYNDDSNWENGVLYIGNHLIIAKSSISGGYTIKSGTKCIGEYAFSGCSGLTSITIPNSVTSIGEWAFGRELVSVTIENGMTSIGNRAFSGCRGLTSITIPDSVTSIGDYAFDGCTGLTSITIPDSVTSIGRAAFGDCTKLTSITIPDSVTSIGDVVFSGCSGLTSITIPNSVTRIGSYAFYHCRGLTSITIPNSVTSIGREAFRYCTGLTSITIPDSVTRIGSSAFCDTAYYNDDFNWENGVLYIGNHLIKVKSSISGGYTIKSGTKCIGGEAFRDCTKLTNITIPDSVTSIGEWAFRDCTKLTSITIPNSVTSIGGEAFRGCKLTSITIPDSVTSIGNRAFSGCEGLKIIRYEGSKEKWNALISGVEMDFDGEVIYNYKQEENK